MICSTIITSVNVSPFICSHLPPAWPVAPSPSLQLSPFLQSLPSAYYSPTHAPLLTSSSNPLPPPQPHLFSSPVYALSTAPPMPPTGAEQPATSQSPMSPSSLTDPSSA